MKNAGIAIIAGAVASAGINLIFSSPEIALACPLIVMGIGIGCIGLSKV